MSAHLDTKVGARDADGQEHRLSSPIRHHARAIDRHVGARMRTRRILLGLTQRELAALIGVTLQQACKYEAGANRVASGRLYQIARALDTDVGYFFEGMGRDDPSAVTQQHRLLLKLARDFIAIPNRRHQEELVSLARTLAGPDAIAVPDSRRRRRPTWVF